MPRHNGVTHNVPLSPAGEVRGYCDDGTRIRATPYGTTVGLCYWSHYVTVTEWKTIVTGDNMLWEWTTDHTTGVSGWVRSDCLWFS